MAMQYVLVTREDLVKALATGEPRSGRHGHANKAAERDISHVWRDERGRWKDTPGIGDDEPRKPKGTPKPYLAKEEIESEAETLFQKIHKEGGFTYEPVDNTSPTEGLALSIFPDRERSWKIDDLTVEDIEDFLWDNADLWESPGNKVGGWHDTETGVVYLDISRVLAPDAHDEAIRLCKKHGQEGYFNLGTFETIIVKDEEERRRKAKTTKKSYGDLAAGDISGVSTPQFPEGYSRGHESGLNREDNVAVVKAAWMSVKGFDGPIIDQRTRSLTTPEELVSIKSIGPNRIASYLVLWGHKSRKDISGEYFTRQTQEMDAIFKSIGKIPLLYHHAMDDTMKSLVVGMVDVMEMDDVGLWIEAQVKEHQAYKRFLQPLIEAKALGLSSGTLPGARKVDRISGEIKRWPIVEASMTPTPAEWRMVAKWPVQNIKAAYRRAGLDIGVLDHKMSELEAENQRFARAEIERERERLALLSL